MILKTLPIGIRQAAAALTTGLVTLVVTAAPAAAWPSDAGPAVYGELSGPLTTPGYEGQRAVLRLDASSRDIGVPSAAHGTFRYAHVLPGDAPFVAFAGDVDCLMVAGDVAVVTGRITTAEVPDGGSADEWLGTRGGFMVTDHGARDRFGWSWWTGTVGTDVPYCVSTPPFLVADDGGVVVRDMVAS
jgi:hypothetical protein